MRESIQHGAPAGRVSVSDRVPPAAISGTWRPGRRGLWRSRSADRRRFSGGRANAAGARAGLHAAGDLDWFRQPVRRRRARLSRGLPGAVAVGRRLDGDRARLLSRAPRAPHRAVHDARHPRAALRPGGARARDDRRRDRLHDDCGLSVPRRRTAAEPRGRHRRHAGRPHHRWRSASPTPRSPACCRSPISTSATASRCSWAWASRVGVSHGPRRRRRRGLRGAASRSGRALRHARSLPTPARSFCRRCSS